MPEPVLRAYVWQRSLRVWALDRLIIDESGEGVISAAIAVLIMAFLGVILWKTFSGTLTTAGKNVDSKVNDIGKP